MDALRNLCDAVYQRIGRVGATLLFERQKQVTGWAVFGLLLLLVGLEFYPGPAFLSEVQPRVVDRWLAGQAGPGAAAQFPVSQLTHPQQIYATLVHGKPIIGGFFPLTCLINSGVFALCLRVFQTRPVWQCSKKLVCAGW